MNDDSLDHLTRGENPTQPDEPPGGTPSPGSGGDRGPLQPGDVVAGRFAVIEPLEFGGMGAVYLVKDRTLDEKRALKVMRPELVGNEADREQFLTELRVSRDLAHKNIVRVYDLQRDADRGLDFFTMEYIPGKTLRQILRESGGRLPVDQALYIARELCDALDCVHAEGVVHRDIKPRNVMVTLKGSVQGAVKLLDFGLAKLVTTETQAYTKGGAGTPYYQSPEQTRGGRLDRRSDLYSLGVVLYEMLTGEIPQGRFRPPSELIEDLPESVDAQALDALVMRCLGPKPEDRSPSAQALRAALDNITVSERRRKPVRIAVSVVLLALAVGLVTPVLRSKPDAPELDVPSGQSVTPEPKPPTPREEGGSAGRDEETPPPPPKLDVIFQTSNPAKTRYRLGETIEFRVKASTDCSVFLFSTDSAGETTMLFPNAFQAIPLIPGRREVRIPRPETLQRSAGAGTLVAAPPTGLTLLELCATREPVTLDLHDLDRATRPYHVLHATQSVADFLRSAGINDFTQKTIQVVIEEGN